MDRLHIAETAAYRHYKTGHVYDVITDVALTEATKERAVAYQSRKTGQIWVRPFADFHALVELQTGEFVPRFQEFQDRAKDTDPRRPPA